MPCVYGPLNGTTPNERGASVTTLAAGGKIVTSNKEAALAALLRRKQEAGLELTIEQRRALAEIGTCTTNVKADQAQVTAAPVAPPKTVAAPAALPIGKAPLLDAEGQKRLKNLRKKLKDIEILEARLEEGAVLQANQKEKIMQKAELTSALRELTGAC